ncbi:MAG TPA: CARDB domain-containing protein [Thermoleophilaceae bacterium]|nr:CARDB domain-containing protein [Thermoleophilaceae bacterium]
MRRTLLAAAVALAACVVAGPAAGSPPVATVKLVRCSLDDHDAVFQARARSVPGAERMGVRFTLLRRGGDQAYLPVKTPGLDRWRRSQPGVGVFAYSQTLKNLSENAAYRVRVAFRWWDGEGSVVRRDSKRSPACRQYVDLPNLRARVLGASTTTVPDVLRYGVRVVNAGRVSATAVPVRLTVDGHVVDTLTVAALEPGEDKLLGFRGPACRRTVRAEADPDGVIAESSEADNAGEVGCADLSRR